MRNFSTVLRENAGYAYGTKKKHRRENDKVTGMFTVCLSWLSMLPGYEVALALEDVRVSLMKPASKHRHVVEIVV